MSISEPLRNHWHVNIRGITRMSISEESLTCQYPRNHWHVNIRGITRVSISEKSLACQYPRNLSHVNIRGITRMSIYEESLVCQYPRNLSHANIRGIRCVSISVRHCGLVVPAPAWDETGCEFDSWYCRIYIPCSLNLRLLGSLRGSLDTYGLTQKLC